MIKVIIFDIGGIVINFNGQYEISHKLFTGTQKIFKVNWQDVEKEYDKLPEIETGEISMDEFWKKLTENLKIKDLKRFKKVWKKIFTESMKVNRDVVRLIRTLKKSGFDVVALSNSFYDHGKIVKNKGYYRYFDKVFLSYELGLQKPDKEIYDYVADKMGVKPDECLFIDDKKTNVDGAKKAGMIGIQFINSKQLKKDIKQYL